MPRSIWGDYNEGNANVSGSNSNLKRMGEEAARRPYAPTRSQKKKKKTPQDQRREKKKNRAPGASGQGKRSPPTERANLLRKIDDASAVGAVEANDRPF